MRQGDCREVLGLLPDNCADAVVTDPPAGIRFLNLSFDTDLGGRQAWVGWLTPIMKETARILKPGGHLLVWALPRTSHWTATALEDAGFQIRDAITHVFGTGYPKSQSMSEAGMPEMGTALKPAAEVWWLCRNQFAETTALRNVTVYGTGALNIDACRIASNSEVVSGRWPANFMISHHPECQADCSPDCPVGSLDAQAGIRRSGILKAGQRRTKRPVGFAFGKDKPGASAASRDYGGDQGGASRFFYCSKPSASEKNAGLGLGERNTHPTCKPLGLMRYLVRLITPPGGLVMDPFSGSGTTGVAALQEGRRFIGIEQDPEWHQIAGRRISAAVVKQRSLWGDD